MPSPVEETIAEIASSQQPLPKSRLGTLSNLDLEALELFEQAWSQVAPELRRSTIIRLTEMAEDDISLNFDDIFRLCLGDSDAGVRSQAIAGLWESEDTSLIRPLVDLMENDASTDVRAAAATALGHFALLGEFGKLRTKHIARVEEPLLSAVRRETNSLEVRRRALEAVAPLGLPEVGEAIQEAYDSDDTGLKISAVNAMGKNCSPAWLPILIQEMHSPDAEMRSEAAAACGGLGEKEAVPHLIALVDDPDTTVALAAIKALGETGGTEAKRFLKRCLDDPEVLVRQAAKQALDELAIEEDPFSLGL